MRIQEIKIGELEEFLQSDIFQHSKNIPISPLRAIAQKNNPRADSENIALLLAIDASNEVVSYVGCLPDQLAQNPSEKISWNSGWWRDPEKGKRIALPLLLRAIQLWEGRFLFDDLPDRSKEILERMGGFSFRKIPGLRCFLRFKFHKILPQKNTSLKFFQAVFKSLDSILNASYLKLTIFWWHRFQTKYEIRLESVLEIDAATGAWIARHNQQELIGRTAKELNWILNYPWMSSTQEDELSKRYFFSSRATLFENQVLKLWEKETLIGVLFFTNRDQQVKLPYVYFDKDKIQLIVYAILKTLIKLKAESFVCFQKEICEALMKQKTPFYYQKKIYKTFGIAQNLENYLEESPIIQDGDGDWVFT